jgi:phosphoribosylformylglycinamidine synthase
VGGIIRDVLAMGARPVALLNSLRFGSLDDERNRYLFREVVRGVGGYGNAIGVPTVGGEVEFARAYSGNPLVNAMCVGLVRSEGLMRARAAGEGNLVVLFGAKTGRDGIHGATFASDELSEESEEKRPNVQVGDPFAEKMLVECSLRLLEEGLIVSLQDLGAAGIASSASEMAAKGGVGIEIDAEKVPLREEGMEPWEIVISESQERMLAIVELEKVEEVLKLAERYELVAAVVGRVDWARRLASTERRRGRGHRSCPSPRRRPVYEREVQIPAYLEEARKLDPEELPAPQDYNAVLLSLLAHPNLCSRRPVYEQYDHQVGTDTVVVPGADAAVMRVKDTTLGFAATTDCKGRYCYLDPRGGAAAAVAEAYRNLSCVGADRLPSPTALLRQPRETRRLLPARRVYRGVCPRRARLSVSPVVSGNVSLYNETEGRAIYPTPTRGNGRRLRRRRPPCDAGNKAGGRRSGLVGNFRPVLEDPTTWR